jgi:two-component system cell cycle response regulator
VTAQILVVDDTADNLTLMVYLLQAAGHQTLSAATGEQALCQARANLPDLIMLDVQLPDLDGYTILARLREDERLAEVPVIAVTAYAMVGDRDHALAAGFDGYLAKPIDPYTFASAVDVHLPVALHGRAFASHADSQAPAARAPSPVQSARHATVLAVDDSSVNVSLLRSVLEPHGYRVTTARTLRAAIDALGANRPDVVLSDVHIGSDSGADLRAFMRADPELAALPFAFLTAADVIGEQVVDEPHIRIIHRPIEPSQLLRELAAILGSG